MFGKGKFRWFDEWMRKNPTDPFLPAIPVAIIGGGVVAATLLVFWGNPVAKVTEQTGPRGTGMVYVANPDDVDRLAALNVVPVSEPPWVPEGGELLAGEAYQNVQVLNDLTVDNFNRLMAAITEWVAPEQGCSYCHADEGFELDDVYTKVVARRMIQMTRALNTDWEVHTAPAGVTCWTCHRGNNVPEYKWTLLPPVNETVGPQAAYQNRAMGLTNYTSLPSNAVQAYLLEGLPVAVNDTAPRVDNTGLPGMKETERTYGLMMHITRSLGVNCTYCHNTRAINLVDQVTPQWTTATLGIAMTQDLNLTYLAPLQDVLPPHRLGPLGDAPKAYCMTCHQGARKPLLGQTMLVEWPELVSETPAYD